MSCKSAGLSPSVKRGGLRSLRLGDVPEHRKHEVAKLGERLRLRWHDEGVIKDRRYHMRSYSKCFPANLAVDCLMDRGDSDTRQQAVCIMKNLQRFELVHHVVDGHEFKDDFLFFRFREDDGTHKPDPSPQDIIAGQRLYSRLVGTPVIQDRKYHGKVYTRCVVGNELVDFLIAGGMFPSRAAAVEHCRDLLEAGVLHHVCYDHHFNDGFLFYRFENDEEREGGSPPTSNKPGSTKRPPTKESTSSSKAPDARSNGRAASFSHCSETNHSNNSYSSTSSSEASATFPFLSQMELEPSGIGSLGRTMSASSALGHGRTSSSPSRRSRPVSPAMHGRSSSPSLLLDPASLHRGGSPAPTSPPPFIFQVTVDQMLNPEFGFQRRTVRVVSDPVGFGFVIRGGRPVYVHTVDPTGPAAQSGLQVGDLLVHVNGHDVTDMSHGQVARIIVQSSAVADMVVMVHPQLQSG